MLKAESLLTNQVHDRIDWRYLCHRLDGCESSLAVTPRQNDIANESRPFVLNP